jgi:hypothetical protein
MTNVVSSGNEFANPHQYLSQNAKINEKIRRIVSKVKAVPMKITYDIEVVVASELDAHKFIRKMMYTFFNWYFYSIDYYGLKIDCFFDLPDDKTLEIVREIKLDTDNKNKKIKFPLIVTSYLPIFQIDIDDLEVCSNDDEVNWDYIGTPRPTKDFRESLKGLYDYENESSENRNLDVQKVFWTNYQYNLTQYPVEKNEDNKPWSTQDIFPKT